MTGASSTQSISGFSNPKEQREIQGIQGCPTGGEIPQWGNLVAESVHEDSADSLPNAFRPGILFQTYGLRGGITMLAMEMICALIYGAWRMAILTIKEWMK